MVRLLRRPGNPVRFRPFVGTRKYAPRGFAGFLLGARDLSLPKTEQRYSHLQGRLYFGHQDRSVYLQVVTKLRSRAIPLRRAYDARRPNAYSDSSEMLHGHVRRAVCERISDVCLYLRGEFDIYNKRELAALLASSAAYRTITVDLAQTRFIDASILGVFARFADLRRELEAAQLRIVNVNRFIFKLFSICRLDTLFCIEEQPHG